MSNVLAGIGRGQLKVLPDRVNIRRRNFERYKAYFDHLKPKGYDIRMLHEHEGFFANRWLTTIIIDPAANMVLQ